MSLRDFSWIIEGELAGMAMPDGTPDDVSELKRRGVAARYGVSAATGSAAPTWPRIASERAPRPPEGGYEP